MSRKYGMEGYGIPVGERTCGMTSGAPEGNRINPESEIRLQCGTFAILSCGAERGVGRPMQCMTIQSQTVSYTNMPTDYAHGKGVHQESYYNCWTAVLSSHVT